MKGCRSEATRRVFSLGRTHTRASGKESLFRYLQEGFEWRILRIVYLKIHQRTVVFSVWLRTAGIFCWPGFELDFEDGFSRRWLGEAVIAKLGN